MAWPHETDTRSRLLDRALRLFVARGYDGVGIAEVVAEAGVTKPSAYHHFGSKLGLLQALVDEGLEPLFDQLKVAADYRHDLPRTLAEVARVTFAFARQERDLTRLHLSLWFAPRESEGFQVIARYHERVYQLMEAVFRAAAADHGNMKGRHRAYAATFLGMLNTWVALELNGVARLDEAQRHQAVHQFMHGIFS
jgi:TetR/AcrR family transcriptional regulator